MSLERFALTVILVVFGFFAGLSAINQYNASENRKAYLECLAAAERIANLQAKDRIISVPSCHLR